ncbi:MAG: nucleoside monophosphate kinase [bacterium]|nr:nucleoside monophosphate kinase [bacterium]
MNIIIIGPQGSGKGTQALFLSEKFNAEHIEVGRILRKLAKEDNDLGRELNEIMHIKKELASDEIIVKALAEEFKNVSPEKSIILDGAPRRIDQIEDVEKVFSDSRRKIDKVIYLSVSEKESIERISKRYSCAKCHKHFTIGENLSSPNDLCDVCNSPIKQREDDTEEGIRKRLSIFHEETYPVVEYYRNKGNLIEIDGMQSKKEVFDEVLDKIES